MSTESALAIYSQIGQRIAKLRKSRDPRLRQEDLASAAHLSRASMVNIERGRHRIQIHVLYDIARALGVEPTDLLPPGTSSEFAAQIPTNFAKQLSPKELALVGSLLGGRKGDSHESR